MPHDPLANPLAVLTEHPVLGAAEEAALLEIIRAGAHARAVLALAPPTAVAATQDQIDHGEAARATLARHNMRLVVSIAPVSYTHLTLPTNREV